MPLVSFRYSHAATKHLDGKMLGSSSLWAHRAAKGYGMYPHSRESRPMEKFPDFDYTPEQIELARNVRTNYFERILLPKEIAFALQYSPVSMDIEIYSSVWSDRNSVFTLPDQDDDKHDIDHTVTVYDHDNNGLIVDTGWLDWGDKGMGYIPYEYLDRHFITAFATIALDNFGKLKLQKLQTSEEFQIQGDKWYLMIYEVPSLRGDERRHYNMEILSKNASITGWSHFASDSKGQIEIQELFVLPEYRSNGLGSFLFKKIQSLSSTDIVTAYIASHDLSQGKDEVVTSFLLKHGYVPYPDRSKFYDSRFRIEPLENI